MSIKDEVELYVPKGKNVIPMLESYATYAYQVITYHRDGKQYDKVFPRDIIKVIPLTGKYQLNCFVVIFKTNIIVMRFSLENNMLTTKPIYILNTYVTEVQDYSIINKGEYIYFTLLYNNSYVFSFKLEPKRLNLKTTMTESEYNCMQHNGKGVFEQELHRVNMKFNTVTRGKCIYLGNDKVYILNGNEVKEVASYKAKKIIAHNTFELSKTLDDLIIITDESIMYGKVKNDVYEVSKKEENKSNKIAHIHSLYYGNTLVVALVTKKESTLMVCEGEQSKTIALPSGDVLFGYFYGVIDNNECMILNNVGNKYECKMYFLEVKTNTAEVNCFEGMKEESKKKLMKKVEEERKAKFNEWKEKNEKYMEEMKENDELIERNKKNSLNRIVLSKINIINMNSSYYDKFAMYAQEIMELNNIMAESNKLISDVEKDFSECDKEMAELNQMIKDLKGI